MENHSRRLRAMLEQLKEEIERTEFLDEEGGKILGRLEQDLRSLLARSDELPGGQGRTLAERLRQGIQHFEVTHPTLTSLMEQVVNTLSGMGF